MRTYPLGIISIDKTTDETFSLAAEFSCITHPDPRCVVSCCLVSGLVRGVLRGEVVNEGDLNGFIEETLEWVFGWIDKRRNDQETKTEPDLDREEFYTHVYAQNLEDLQLDDMRKMGYVYKALGAGILTLRLGMRWYTANLLTDHSKTKGESSNFFERSITTLILRGGDADTNACVAGALLGALIGYSDLPANWRDGLMHSAWLLGKSEDLCDMIGIHGGDSGYKGSEDPDTRVDGGKGVLTREELDAREKAFLDFYMAKAQEKVRSEKEKEKEKGKGWMGRFLGQHNLPGS